MRAVISVISLDAGDTMLYCDPSPAEIYASALARHGPSVDAEEVGPVFRDAWAALQERTAPGRDRYSSAGGDERLWWRGFLIEVLARLDHPAPVDRLLEELYAVFARPEIWHLFPDTVVALEACRARGLGLAVISNWDRRLPRILDDLGLTPWFDHITVSSLAGVEKPAPEIFLSTVEALRVPREEVLHVGDSPREDYAGAREAGLQARLIDREGRFVDGAYRTVASLVELADL
jgi:putative hydrolase of the HAD superfamily